MKLNETNYIERDVIVPAARIFIAVASAVNAEDIIVPIIGLSDGIINDLALKHFSSTPPSR